MSSYYRVALYTSAWIEIRCGAGNGHDTGPVALYTSAWIEIQSYININSYTIVALYTSAWIEIAVSSDFETFVNSRTLHECVD